MATKIVYQREVPVPEAIVRVLEEGGFGMVFGISGGKSKYFFHALPGPSFHDENNACAPASKVAKVYNGRREIEDRIKEGKKTLRWDKTSCCRFAAEDPHHGLLHLGLHRACRDDLCQRSPGAGPHDTGGYR